MPEWLKGMDCKSIDNVYIGSNPILPIFEISKMIKDAEQNSSEDKLKKSLVNITYEFDNLFEKLESILKYCIPLNTLSIQYLEELFKIVKKEYKKNQFENISNQSLKKLQGAFEMVLMDYFKHELKELSTEKSSNSNTIIDVSEE